MVVMVGANDCFVINLRRFIASFFFPVVFGLVFDQKRKEQKNFLVNVMFYTALRGVVGLLFCRGRFIIWSLIAV